MLFREIIVVYSDHNKKRINKCRGKLWSTLTPLQVIECSSHHTTSQKHYLLHVSSEKLYYYFNW
jgi:hypothetical protein